MREEQQFGTNVLVMVIRISDAGWRTTRMRGTDHGHLGPVFSPARMSRRASKAENERRSRRR